MVQRAATADGADKSGLTALTWPTVANFAVDAAMAVALANTLFFAAATGESKGRVALYLLITIAPFAVIAPSSVRRWTGCSTAAASRSPRRSPCARRWRWC